MPIYEYECTSCGHRFEKMVKIGAEAPACPECAANVRKLISQSAFILKGGGWYKDHYGLKNDSSGSKDAPAATAKGGEGAKSEGAKSEGAKSEGAKSEGAKSEGTKSESAAPAKSETSPSKAAPAATPSSAAK